MDRSHAIVVHQNGSQVPTLRSAAIPVVVTPVTDIYETDREYVVRLDMPGTKRETIRVELRPGVLEVTADASPGEFNAYAVRHREILWNRFTRSFNLGPGIDTEHITASISDGVLVLRIPKSDDAMSRDIPIQ